MALFSKSEIAFLKNALVYFQVNFSELELKQYLIDIDIFSANLIKWNKVYNLTAIRETGDVIDKHLIDSIGIFPILATLMQKINLNTIIDIGTGAGLPVIPLALIFRPQKFISVESNQKKVTFQQYIKNILRINNLVISQNRVEYLTLEDINNLPCSLNFTNEIQEWQMSNNIFISRAFADISKFINSIYNLVCAGDYVILMQSKVNDVHLNKMIEDINILSFNRAIRGNGFKIEDIIKLSLPTKAILSRELLVLRVI